MPKLTWTNETDTGTGDKKYTVTDSNGYTKYSNPLTGTTTYGKRLNNGDAYYDPTPSVQASNKAGYNGTRGSSGSGGGGVSAGGGGGGFSGPSWQDILSQIMEYAKQQKTALDAQALTAKEQGMADVKRQFEGDRNVAIKNAFNTDRLMRDMYGNAMTGYSNRTRNMQNLASKMADLRAVRSTNEANVNNTYNSALANNANIYQQAWLNSVLPTYANRQTLIDNLAYRNM